jgi:superfamily II DNA/RNA helicase
VAEGYLAPTNIHTFVDVPSKDKLEVLTDIFSNYAGQMGQTMVFVKTKKEVSAITLVLQTLGYIAVGVTDQSEKELNNTLEEFSEGAVQFIVNCNKINEGVDVKGCTDVVLGRQFGSYPQLNQVIGRAARPDSDCNVWELINPLSGRNLDTTVVVGTPEFHRLVNKEGGAWVERQFDYITHRTNKQLGIASGIRIRH